MDKLDFERLIDLQGRTVEFVKGTPPTSTVNVLAQVRRARNSPAVDILTGGMTEDLFMVICSTKEMDLAVWGAPKTGDRIRFDGEYHLIRADYPLFLSEVLVGYRLQVQG